MARARGLRAALNRRLDAMGRLTRSMLMTIEIITPAAATRKVWSAMRRGARLRCPACGEGRLFRAYLKVTVSDAESQPTYANQEEQASFE